MARYASMRARSYIVHGEDGASFMPSLYVDEHGAKDTGLIDRYGNSICRLPDRIGF